MGAFDQGSSSANAFEDDGIDDARGSNEARGSLLEDMKAELERVGAPPLLGALNIVSGFETGSQTIVVNMSAGMSCEQVCRWAVDGKSGRAP